MTCLTDWYAEGRRLEELATAEAAALGSLGPVTRGPDAVAWAEDVATRCRATDLPLTRATAMRWGAALPAAGLAPAALTSLPTVADALVRAAVATGALVPPVPGVVRLAFAHRGPDETERAWGWGLVPEGTEALILHGSRALDEDDLTSTPEVGAGAVLHVLDLVAFTLRQTRRGPARRRPNR